MEADHSSAILMPVTFESDPEWQPVARQVSDLAAAFPAPPLPDTPLPQAVSSRYGTASINDKTNVRAFIKTSCQDLFRLTLKNLQVNSGYFN
jgi:hypothetical protein